MKISYQVLCKNEGESLRTLLNFLIKTKEAQDEINVSRDSNGTNQETLNILEEFKEEINHFERPVPETIHNQKNWLATKATGDYLFYLDADELLYPQFVENLHEILEGNTNVDIFFLPRINTVEGLTPEYVQERGWNVDKNGWINFPDWQDRLFKHNAGISYNEIPHGRLTNEGKQYSTFPAEPVYAILHHKSMNKQVQDNSEHDQRERDLGLRK